MTENQQTTENQPTEQKPYDYRKIAIAVCSGLAVALGVYFDAIPLDFITNLFATKS